MSDTQDTHVALVMSYNEELESYGYSAGGYFKSLDEAIDCCRNNSCAASPGEILIACDMAEISDLPNTAYNMYVVNESRTSLQAPKKTPLARLCTWISFWEYNKRSDLKLRLAIKEEINKESVLAICECVDGLSKYISDEACRKEADAVIASSIEYAHGQIERTINRHKIKNIDSKKGKLSGDIVRLFFDIAMCVWSIQCGNNTAAKDSAFDVLNGMDIFCEENLGFAYNEKLAQCDQVIRKHIPLHKILLAVSRI